jgi:hypothetical protein
MMICPTGLPLALTDSFQTFILYQGILCIAAEYQAVWTHECFRSREQLELLELGRIY